MVQRPCLHSVPHFAGVRRVPTRYQRILPLAFMQQCQCVVLGAAPGVLTVAVSDPTNKALLFTLKTFTGCEIFPVFVEEGRMRMLLQRLERTLRYQQYYPRVAFIAYLV